MWDSEIASKYTGNMPTLMDGVSASRSGMGIASHLLATGVTSHRQGKLRVAIPDQTLQRSLADMSDQEVEMAKALHVLHLHGFLSENAHKEFQLALVFDGGNCRITRTSSGEHDAVAAGAASDMLRKGGFVKGVFVGYAREALSTLLQKDDPRIRQAVRDVLGTGNDWAGLTDFEGTIFTSGPAAAALTLGMTEGGSIGVPITYTANESLVTIAPPGAGKTQALVLPNLVEFVGPALVLDVKGECFAHTAGWRAANVGPVLRFAPANSDTSAHYNPLDMVSDEPRRAWKDARLLADMLVVPKGRGKDDYFEQRGRDLVTAIIMLVALEALPDKRHMGTVMDLLYAGPEEFAGFVERCRQSDVDQLRRIGNMLATMPDKQREGVYDTARTHLEIWQSDELGDITRRSDWTPGDLRSRNATLYLCVGLNEVSAYASVLRVIIGQLIHAETQGDTERRGQVPLTLFLDELPRLGYMAPIESALDVGRGYGVRLWMFAQNFGQLAERYENAKGMIGNCGVELYMNPDAETARSIASRLGDRTNVLDGAKRPLADAVELAGPDYRDRILVLGRGCRPARLSKIYAFDHADVSARLRLPLP